MHRRQIVTSLAGLAVLTAADASAFAAPAATENAPPLRIFNPRQYGAAADGKTMDSRAINAAIDACSRAGGGVVYLAPGGSRALLTVTGSQAAEILVSGCDVREAQPVETGGGAAANAVRAEFNVGKT